MRRRNRLLGRTQEEGLGKWDAVSFAEVALAGEPRLSISRLLEAVAQMCDAFGCVLWRASDKTKPTATPPKGQMSMLAGWFDTDISAQLLAIHHLPLRATISGKAVCTGRAATSNDLIRDKVLNSDHRFFLHHKITRALAVPVRYSGGRRGAVEIYRRIEDVDFRKGDALRLRSVAQLVPHLYKAVRHRAGFDLLRETGEILRRYRSPEDPRKASARQTRTLKELCTAIQEMFHAVEVSVFLEAEDQPTLFACAYTTPGPHADATKERKYRSSFTDGFSGLALETGEAIRIYDTQECNEQVRELQEKYPEFKRVSRGLSRVVNADLQVPKGWSPPPHPLMVVPIVSSLKKTFGFLRCWIAREGPPFFSGDDLDLLRLIGEQFANTLEGWNRDRHGANEREAWTRLGENIGRPGGPSKSGLAQPDDPYVQGLRLVELCIPDADIITIRRIRRTSPGKEELFFYAYLYQPSANLTAHEVDAAVHKYSPLTFEQPRNLATVALQQGKPLVIANVDEAGPLYTPIFRGVKKMIIAPIFDGEEPVGVLDIRSCKSEPFLPYALPLADAVGRLLGVYASRHKAKGEAKRAKLDKELLEVRNRAALEDIHHQMKGPLAEAVRRVNDLLDGARRSEATLSSDLIAIRSTLHRSSLMSRIIGLLATLDAGQDLPIRRAPLTAREIGRLAAEIVQNNCVRISKKRDIRIFCDDASFSRFTPADLLGDADLLAQALNNLVDNAVKYSYANTAIRVFGGRTGRTNAFYIAVTNIGVPIRSNEVPLCAQRNWRGEKARATAGEGNGIGLWVVHHIMRAHGGYLEVLPTRQNDDITEVRLVFVKL